MCNFFSFITYKGKKFYFNDEQRKTEHDSDSHSRIAEVFLASTIKEDMCNKYEYTNGQLRQDQINDKEEEFDDVKDWANKFGNSRSFAFIAIRGVLAGSAHLTDIPPEYKEKAERLLHEHACYSAESCLELYEKQFPGDSRVRDAITAKHKWINKEITDEELSAANSAADGAASAAYSAAYHAAYRAANSAAYSAANSAAYSAANSAASAAYSAANSAQQELLTKLMEEAFPLEVA